MDRLITDIFVRRVAQIVLLSALGLLILLLLIFDVTVVEKIRGDLDGRSLQAAVGFFDLLSVPFKDSFAPFMVVGAGVVPIALTTVCFAIDKSGAKPIPSENLNRVGHVALVCLLAGFTIGAVSLILLALVHDPIDQLADGPDKRAAIQGLVASIISFKAIFFTQLLGLKPK